MTISDPIVIVGGGSMGSSLALRWRAAVASSAGIHVIDPSETVRRRLAAGGITVHEKMESFNLARGIVVLAVKPQVFFEIADQIKQYLVKGSVVVVSIMAGVTLETLQKITPRCVRLMPNTPAVVGEGMTVACNPRLEPGMRMTISKLFELTGRMVWVEDEALMHTATAVSGSGPAYVFAFMEALERAAREIGMPAPIARQLVVQTVLGAATLAKQSEDEPALLRRNVTSSRGTTEAALLTLLKDGAFTALIEKAVRAAHTRSIEMAENAV